MKFPYKNADIPEGTSYAIISVKVCPDSSVNHRLELYEDRASWEAYIKSKPGADFVPVVLTRAKVDTTVTITTELPKTTPQLRNCWGCRHARRGAKECVSLSPGRSIWIEETHGGDDECPPDADGCPGWEAK